MEKLQEMANKFYKRAVETAKTRGQKIINTNSNENFIKLRRVLNLLLKRGIEANFESFIDRRKKVKDLTFTSRA